MILSKVDGMIALPQMYQTNSPGMIALKRLQDDSIEGTWD
jgi:hypothetical protein